MLKVSKFSLDYLNPILVKSYNPCFELDFNFQSQNDPIVIKHILNHFFKCFAWIYIKKIGFNIKVEDSTWEISDTKSYDIWIEEIFKDFKDFEEDFILDIPTIEFCYCIENKIQFNDFDYDGGIYITYDEAKIHLNCSFYLDMFGFTIDDKKTLDIHILSDLIYNRTLLEESIRKFKTSNVDDDSSVKFIE